MSISAIASAAAVILGLLALIAVAVGGKRRANAFGRFSSKSLLNKSEKKLMIGLGAVTPEVFGPGARILSQVSYGEFLEGEDRATHARINQKRADFVIVDGNFEVLCVIEYQGSGHYGRGKEARKSVMARDFDRQVAELQIRAAVLNGYTALGIPVTEPVG